MSQSTEVIKRHGNRQTESFDPVKVHTSVRAACLSVRSPEGEAEMIAKSVADFVAKWCHQKPAVTSADLRRVATQFLQRLHPEAAYLYENHQLVI